MDGRYRESIAYEIDPHNRLVARRSGKASGVRGFRRVIDGSFKIDKDNSLAYHVKKSSNFDTPQHIRFRGNYSLDKDHNLVFTLSKWSNQVVGNRLIIKAGLLDTKDNELSFTVGTRDVLANRKVYILKLSGAWKADKQNRLSFNVSKENGAEDSLVLQGAWQVNAHNEIIYTHAKESVLTFKGRWDIGGKHAISYVLNRSSGSGFDFKAGLLRAEKNRIKYRINIGARPKARTFELTGEWKLSERLGLLFEIPYEAGTIKAVSFGAECRLNEKDTVEFTLKGSRGEKLGVNLNLSRKILEGRGEAFIKALKDGREVSVSAGAGFRW